MTLVLQPDQLDTAIEISAKGGLVAFPTETVYGLGADATNPEAVARVFEAKGRPAGHPLIVHLADPGQLSEWSDPVEPRAQLLARACWPGPLTLVVESSGRAVSAVTGGRPTVGLRMPDHPVTNELLARFGGGLVGPSANRFGRVSPTTADHVMADLDGRIDAVVDGGPCRVGVESTIVEVLPGRPLTLLRPGGVSAAGVEKVVGEAVVDGRAGESRAAGMLASHYAPQATVAVVAAQDLATELERAPADAVVISPSETVRSTHRVVEVPADSAGFARELYAALRAADALAPPLIVVMEPAEGPLAAAVRDRLSKAAGPRG